MLLCYHPALRGDQTRCTGWRHYMETFSIILVQCVDHRSPWVPCTKGRCRRGSSTQEQRYPPPLPLGATATPTCRRRESGPGLTVTTQDQEYPLRKLREIRGTYFISFYFYVRDYMNTKQLYMNIFCKPWPQSYWYDWMSKWLTVYVTILRYDKASLYSQKCTKLKQLF